MALSESIPALNAELATEILNKTIEELQSPLNAKKLDEARDTTGNEMTKAMQLIFPIIMQVQMDVIKTFGFPNTKESIIKFAQLIRTLEREDTEIARLHGLIKAFYLPPVSISTANESPAEERTSSS